MYKKLKYSVFYIFLSFLVAGCSSFENIASEFGYVKVSDTLEIRSSSVREKLTGDRSLPPSLSDIEKAGKSEYSGEMHSATREPWSKLPESCAKLKEWNDDQSLHREDRVKNLKNACIDKVYDEVIEAEDWNEKQEKIDREKQAAKREERKKRQIEAERQKELRNTKSHPQEDKPFKSCDDLFRSAVALGMARQNGTDKETLLSDLESGTSKGALSEKEIEIIEDIIDDAFKMKRFDEERRKAKAAQDLGNKWLSKCHYDRGIQ